MPDDALTCQYCPRDDFGNAGARASHEAACDQNPANQESGGGGGREQRAAPPARREAEGQGELAMAEEQGPGSRLADIGIALFDDDVAPQKRTEAVGGLLGLAQQGVNRYNQYRQAKMAEQEERAKNVELEKVADLPKCGECDYQFGPDDIGINDERVRCPECQSLWRIGLKE